MDLSPGACSLAPHIAMHEAGLAFEPVVASTKSHQLKDGTDYYGINPLGYVPMLELDDGTRLREAAVIVQYIADLAPAKNLAPANGTLLRYRLQEWLNFVGTEMHKGFSPLFNANMPDEAKTLAKTKLQSRFKWLDGELEGKAYLMGEHFSVADCYLFTVTNWTKPTGIDLAPYPNVQAWHARVGERPAVQQAMQAETAAR
ncbi:MAG: glutathione transferase GstA [Variovorax sp.]